MPDKEKEVKELLNADGDDMAAHFHEAVAAAERITDFDPAAAEGGAGDGGDDEEEVGVAVDFDDEDEEEGGPGVLRGFSSGTVCTCVCGNINLTRRRRVWLCTVCMILEEEGGPGVTPCCLCLCTTGKFLLSVLSGEGHDCIGAWCTTCMF